MGAIILHLNLSLLEKIFIPFFISYHSLGPQLRHKCIQIGSDITFNITFANYALKLYSK